MTNDPDKADRYLILLEQIQGQVNQIAEGYEVLNVKIDTLRSDLVDTEQRLQRQIEGVARHLSGRMDSLDGRMDSLEGRMDSLDGRMDSLDGRMDSLDGRMGSLETKMDHVCTKVDSNTHKIYELSRYS